MTLIEKYDKAGIEQRKQMFYNYMMKSGLKDSSCKQYAFTHTNNDAVINAVYEVTKKYSLFEVIDLFQAQAIYEKVLKTDANKKVNNSLSATIYNYKKFIDKMETQQDDSNDSVHHSPIKNETVIDNSVTTTPNKPNVWVYAPGEGARKWQECQDRNVMLLGWDEMENFQKYASRKDIVKSLREVFGNFDNSYVNDSLAIWQFCREMHPGDIVYAKKGTSMIIGRGIIKGEYKYDKDSSEYKNSRYVEWMDVEEHEYSMRLPQKTLTCITGYTDMIERLEKLFEPVNEVQQIPFKTADIIRKIKPSGLIYDDVLIKRFAYSLMSKQFLILSGLAGSGKTQLAIVYAKAMVEDEEMQMCVVPVGADWTNREPLLGYPNALKEGEYVLPENRVLQIMLRAKRYPERPYFLILDEMNLSYVERYFADFLSAMESHMEIPLWHKEGEDEDDVPSSVALPKNLFIIGTINVDETTYMFSPKVLDRANVIEFKVSCDEMDKFLDEAPNVDVSRVNGTAADMAEDFVRKAVESVDISKDANDVLKNFFKQLKTVNAEFGYRTATEIGRFLSMSKDDLGLDMAVDCAIVQKLLPKLHGSRKKLEPVLLALWKECFDKDDKNLVMSRDNVLKAKYPLTADKIQRMHDAAQINGFTSFAEA